MRKLKTGKIIDNNERIVFCDAANDSPTEYHYTAIHRPTKIVKRFATLPEAKSWKPALAEHKEDE